ncbi:MAG: tyrosine-type recombinase/integrase [Hyphomonadaceae bacterium]
MTFRRCAEIYIDAHAPAWRNAKHRWQWRNTLEKHAYPVFGDLDVAAIDDGLIMQVLDPIWQTKNETASRLRGRLEAVLDWARVRGFRSGDNPARWRGHLQKALPAPRKSLRVRHHPAMPYAQIAEFMTALRANGSASAQALEFTILTAARTGEAIGADWSEIDLDQCVWTVPAERMKAGREHRVPLSNRAIEILRARAAVQSGGPVFANRRGEPLSNMALLMLLRRLTGRDFTVHGFRSSFRDWAAEQTDFPREVAEAALAHTLEDKVEAAYRRSDLFEKRAALMAAWTDFCDSPRRKAPRGGRLASA